MEYLANVGDSLKKIDEENVEWIDIFEHPEYVRGTCRISSDKLDFTKFSMEARSEINQYDELAITEMQNLYRNTSGCRIMLTSNSTKLIIKAQMKRKWSYRKMNMWNSSGFDIYEIINGEYVHKTVFAPYEGKTIFAEQTAPKKGEVCIYLPTYNCIDALFLGIDKGAKIEPYYGNEKRTPIIFYGNSVTQGAAASRSGNCFPNIVQRKLKREIINLSCSSCCRGLESMADEIGRLNCHSIVIDNTRNAYNVNAFEKTHERFYKQIRKYHPEKKIILMTSCNFNDWVDYFRYDEIVKRTYVNALERGENVGLLDVMGLFDQEEYSYIAVDGSHVNDIGMYRIANALIPLVE